MQQAPRRLSATLGPLVLLVLVPAACRAVQGVVEAPGKVTKAVIPGEKKPERPPIAELHAEVLRFADVISATFESAVREFESLEDSPEARLQSLRWRLNGVRSVVLLATGPNPVINLFDLQIYLRAIGRSVEHYWMPEHYGDSLQPALDAIRTLQAEGMDLVVTYMGEEAGTTIQALLDQWSDENQRVMRGSLTGLPSIADLIESMGGEEGKGGGLLGFIQLDPLAGLEPMAREVALARQFAERTVFWTQRLPGMLDLQMTIHTLEARSSPEVQQVLADTERATLAAASIAETAASLPDEITAQREGLVRDLESAREPVQLILADSQATLAAVESTSVQLQLLVAAVDQFLARFEPPEGAPPRPVPDEPPPPFDINDYGEAAARVGEAVVELRGLVEELDESLPRVQTLVDDSIDHGREVVDHAVERALQVGLALIAAAAVAVLLVRFLSRKRAT